MIQPRVRYDPFEEYINWYFGDYKSGGVNPGTHAWGARQNPITGVPLTSSLPTGLQSPAADSRTGGEFLNFLKGRFGKKVRGEFPGIEKIDTTMPREGYVGDPFADAPAMQNGMQLDPNEGAFRPGVGQWGVNPEMEAFMRKMGLKLGRPVSQYEALQMLAAEDGR